MSRSSSAVREWPVTLLVMMVVFAVTFGATRDYVARYIDGAVADFAERH